MCSSSYVAIKALIHKLGYIPRFPFRSSGAYPPPTLGGRSGMAREADREPSAGC